MGNICSAGANYHSRTQTTNLSASTSNASHRTHLSARTQSGKELISIYQLSELEQRRFLSQHDPLQSIPGLNADALVYRSTADKYIKNGMMKGNPKSNARIALHEELRPNWRGRRAMGFQPNTALGYFPKQGRAYELKDPSLNVMYGSNALNAARGYHPTPGFTTVAIRLGDFLERGGKVYSDLSSLGADNGTAHALIVTLPKGKKVPVTPHPSNLRRILSQSVLLFIGMLSLALLVLHSATLIEGLIGHRFIG